MNSPLRQFEIGTPCVLGRPQEAWRSGILMACKIGLHPLVAAFMQRTTFGFVILAGLKRGEKQPSFEVAVAFTRFRDDEGFAFARLFDQFRQLCFGLLNVNCFHNRQN